MRKKQVVLMNFSGIYETESFYETVPQENRIWLDCRTIPGTNCYCDEEGERELKERMEPLGAEGIHFLDSGNYHYVTKLWLDQVKDPSIFWYWSSHRSAAAHVWRYSLLRGMDSGLFGGESLSEPGFSGRPTL